MTSSHHSLSKPLLSTCHVSRATGGIQIRTSSTRSLPSLSSRGEGDGSTRQATQYIRRHQGGREGLWRSWCRWLGQAFLGPGL